MHIEMLYDQKCLARDRIFNILFEISYNWVLIWNNEGSFKTHMSKIKKSQIKSIQLETFTAYKILIHLS